VKKIAVTLFGVITLLLPALTLAQEASQAATTPPSKVLAVFREFMKPGKSGSTHERSESIFVQALRRAKWPSHYLAVDSLSGKTRVLFLTGYDSFDAWEKDVQSTQTNPTLSNALDRAQVADGDLLSETDSSAWVFNADHSLNPDVDLPHMHYFEIFVYRVKPGHGHDWDEIMKLALDAYKKIPDTHWAAYDNVFGSSDNTHVFFVPMKSASEVDRDLAHNKDFADAIGEDGMKRLDELEAAGVESIEANLFVFNPRMSYVPDDWIKADPDFWKPKTASAPAKKAEEKPAPKSQ
jgi:hypothetical protein